MTWTDLQRTRVDVLEIYSSEKISVRLRSMREEYFKFQDSLMIYCSENLDYLQRLQPDQLNNINKFPSLKENCIRVVGPQLRSLQESEIGHLGLASVLWDQLWDYNHCLVRRMSSWHRGLVLSIQDQAVARVRLIDAGEDQDFDSGDLYKLPREFSLKEKGSFAEFVHLSQFPFSASRSSEMVETIREILSEVRSPYFIKRAEQLQFLEDRWSLPVELGWTERRLDNPLGAFYERETCLSQVLSKKGFAFVEEVEDVFEEPGEDGKDGEDGEALSSLVEDHIDDASEDSYAGDPWTEAVLPSNTTFKARGTSVDQVGQIYMHLYEDRRKFREVRRQLAQHSSLLELDDLSEETLSRLEPGQAVLALYDGELHRATFHKYESSDSTRALVQYGDYGTLAWVDSKDIWTDVSSVRETPLLAFRTVLANVLPRGGDHWSNETIDFIYNNIFYGNLKEGATHNKLQVQVLSDPSEEPLLVTIKLFTPVSRGEAQWVDLSEILINRGEAVAATEAEVNSRDQRRIRRQLDFSRKSRRTEETGRIRMIYPVPPCGRLEERLPKMNLHLEGGDLVQCKIIAQLRWNIVSVHLVSPETIDINLKVHNLLEEKGSNLPLAKNPRLGMLVAYVKEDFGWVRGRVVDVDEEQVTVKLVDFQTLELVKNVNTIRVLPEELKMPSPAVVVKLDIAPAEDIDEDSMEALIEESLVNVKGSTFLKVRRSIGYGEVKVLKGQLLDDKKVPVYDYLVEENLIII